MSVRAVNAVLLAAAMVFLAGCPKGNTDYKQGRRAEAIRDFDTALQYYERALKADPLNPEYKLKAHRMRFESAQAHVDQGQRLRDKGELTLALAEFEKAMAIDPAIAVAEQEARATLELIARRQAPQPAPPPTPAAAQPPLQDKPAELMPISREPINLKLTNDSRIIFETIAKLAGLTVIFDPDFQPRRIPTELTNVTLEQALDVVCLQSKTFWKPVASNIILVAPEQTQKRKDYEDYVVRTFYLSNTLTASDLTEIVTGLRQLLNMRFVQSINSQNALVVRDTQDKMLIAEKIIRDLDKARPEVVIQFAVLQARRDRARDLGISPGSSSVLSFTPRNLTGIAGTAPSSLRLSDLQRLSSADYSITLPGASAMALISDSTTRIIQNPEIRVVDGGSAKLRVGDRVPIATGSFQAGLGLGGIAAGGVGGIGGQGAGLVNPLVNTQFQYIEVGVNIDVTPRIHPSRDISIKAVVEVSSVAGTRSIGGIEQPVISQRKIEHDIRLREGEVNILGGLVERSETKSISGWPGLSKIPFLRYLFSAESVESAESEIFIVLIPRIVRLPEITENNLRSLSVGTDTNIQVRPAYAPITSATPTTQPPPSQPPAGAQPGAAAPAQPGPGQPPAAKPAAPPRLLFEPQSVSIKAGETATIALVVENVTDLFSIPILLQYDPKYISLEEVRHGGFLSGGTQEIAIVHRIDKERGQAIVSATRQPNTPGVNGTGTLLALVVKGVATGSSSLGVVQVNARDSQQKAIQMVSGEASIRVP